MTKPMDFNQIASQLSVEVYDKLKIAIEIGRWGNGETLSEQQKQISLQAILQYELEHLSPEQRTGYIPPKKTASESKKVEPLRWKE